VVHELDGRLRADLRNTGEFSRVHPMPQSGLDVPDDRDARLVVLRTDHPYSKEPGCAALAAAKAIFETRGNTPRLYRNALVFLAADRTRLQDLDEAVRNYLAWESILDEKDVLNLTPQQVKQAETKSATADSTVTARIPEVYHWLLVPVQKSPQEGVEWQAFRLPSGQDALAVRAIKKLRTDELLVTGMAGTILRMSLDRVPLWRNNHVAVRQLAEDFARYVYLPRLKDSSVLVGAVRDGLGLLTWAEESFGFADSFDEEMGRYRGLRGGQLVSVDDADSPGLLMKGDVARAQLDADGANVAVGEGSGLVGDAAGGSTGPAPGAGTPELSRKVTPALPKRFHGTVTLDSARVGLDASRVAEEVIAHLTGLVGAKLTLTLEVEAEIPSGASDQVVRVVTENSRALKFTSQRFERE
jgi:hypothetical protein